LYLASAENEPNADSVKVYVLSAPDLEFRRSVEVHNMGHITDIAEDPVTGTVGVVGLRMPTIPSESELQDIGILDRQPGRLAPPRRDRPYTFESVGDHGPGQQ
jgi:hypothetical protein